MLLQVKHGSIGLANNVFLFLNLSVCLSVCLSCFFLSRFRFYLSDFGTVTQKLTLGAYHTLADFRRDVNLIFSNCRRYNRKSSLIFKDALFLSRTFGNILASWKHDRTAATGDGDEAERSGEAFDESADAIAVAAEEDENIGEESE